LCRWQFVVPVEAACTRAINEADLARFGDILIQGDTPGIFRLAAADAARDCSDEQVLVAIAVVVQRDYGVAVPVLSTVAVRILTDRFPSDLGKADSPRLLPVVQHEHAAVLLLNPSLADASAAAPLAEVRLYLPGIAPRPLHDDRRPRAKP